jgi:hypothetical protein
VDPSAYADGSTLSLARAAAVALAVDQEVPAFPEQDAPLSSRANRLFSIN